MVNRKRETRNAYTSVNYTDLEYVINVTIPTIKKMYPHLTLSDFNIEPYNEDPYSDKEYPYLVYKRPETDKEMEDRIAKEEHWEKEREKSEKALFEQLKKKYE